MPHLPEGVKSIRYESEDMTGDYLVIEFNNGLSLSVNALQLGEQECNVAVRYGEGDDLSVLASLEFGVEQKPDAVVYADEWLKFQAKKGTSA